MKLKTILVSIWVLIIVPTMTYALFIDTETSVGNTFSATTLQTQLTPEAIPVELDIKHEVPFVSTSFTLTNIGQLNTVNSLSIQGITNPAFADKITVQVVLDETTTIDTVALSSLNIFDYLFQNVGQTNKVGFIFSISEDNYNATPQESVTFTIKNYARQSGMAFGNGFFDNKSMSITINNPLVAPTPP
jgi:hypothetical protein